MFITVNLVLSFKLRTLWATLYLSILFGIKNSFIKGSKKFRDINNPLEAYSEPFHLPKIVLFAIVNQREALNIFAKRFHLGYIIGLWMPLCVLTVYLMGKKDILRLDKLIDKGDK